MRADEQCMLSPAVTRGVKALREVLLTRYGERLRELVVFGSHARGDAHDESDVDMLVVIDDLTEVERRDVIDLAYDVDRAQPSWLGLSPLPFSTQQVADLRRSERRLFREIDSEGVAL